MQGRLKFGDAHDGIFARRELPEFVFKPAVTSSAWVSFDALCSGYGWELLTALAQLHGDGAVHAVGVDLVEPQLLTFAREADCERYGTVCDNELVAATVVRWWGSSGQWGVQGSRDLEIAVAGQVGEASWPRRADCDVLTIDAALRLARGTEEVRDQLLATYDAISWDPASEDPSALRELSELCRDVQANRVDPVVAIRRFVGLLDRVPKLVRRIAATEQLHKAWTRTQYLRLGEARAAFGPLLLAQNDQNHERHSNEERGLVRQAADEILAAIELALKRDRSFDQD